MISSKKNFVDYIAALATRGIYTDVVINNGRCRPQVAYGVREQLKKGGFMFVRGSYEHYSVIRDFYSLEKEIAPSAFPTKEFQGLNVYRNNKIQQMEEFPSWWYRVWFTTNKSNYSIFLCLAPNFRSF